MSVSKSCWNWVAESCIAGGVGFQGSFTASGRWDATLFGEQQSRIVVSVAPDAQTDLERICTEEDAPLAVLGYVGGDSFSIPGHIDVAVERIASAWRGGLDKTLSD